MCLWPATRVCSNLASLPKTTRAGRFSVVTLRWVFHQARTTAAVRTTAHTAHTSITEIADLTPMIAVAAGQLNDFHGDPADRIIYATAAAHQLPLVSKDNRLRTFAKADRNVAVVW